MYWKDRSSAWGGKKVFLARSGQLRSRRFPSTPLLLTQQKETEFSNLFRVSFANLQKQGEIFPCSPASCWGSSCQHASVAANSSTRRDPKFSRRCRRAAAGTRQERGCTHSPGGYQNPAITAAAKRTPRKNTALRAKFKPISQV